MFIYLFSQYFKHLFWCKADRIVGRIIIVSKADCPSWDMLKDAIGSW